MKKLFQDSYHGNPKVKAAGVKIDFTKEQAEEIVKCSSDPIYFIEKYLKIISLDKGVTDCKLYDFQKKMIQNFIDNRFTISMIARQSGKTTAYAGYIIWYAIFNNHKNIVLLANKIKSAKGILARIRESYQNIPIWLQQGVIEWNKTSIEFENGSRIEVDATSGSAARSGSINILILDEFAFVPNNVADDFFKSVYPTITAGIDTKIIIVSTPNGVNMFYRLWTESTQGLNHYKPFTMHWSEVPGRDEKWKNEIIKNMGPDFFAIEYGCEFFGSVSRTLISPSKLKQIPFISPIAKIDELDVYEHQKAKQEYIICVDVARGDQNNYSAFTIINISQLPYKIVAKYRKNDVEPYVFPNSIVSAARKYNDAYILVEINDVGGQIVDTIKNDLEYDNVLSTCMDKRLSQQKLAIGQPKGFKLGLRTTKSVKRIGCVNLKNLIDDDKLIINDFHVISELSSFISKNGSFEADSDADDDLVMTLVMFGWLTSQKYFHSVTNENLKQTLMKDLPQQLQEIPLAAINNYDGLQKPSYIEDGDLWTVEESDYYNSDRALIAAYEEVTRLHDQMTKKIR